MASQLKNLKGQHLVYLYIYIYILTESPLNYLHIATCGITESNILFSLNIHYQELRRVSHAISGCYRPKEANKGLNYRKTLPLGNPISNPK